MQASTVHKQPRRYHGQTSKAYIIARTPLSSSSACRDNRQDSSTTQHQLLENEQDTESLCLHRRAFERLCEQRQVSLGLDAPPRIHPQNISPPLYTYWSLLRACCRVKALSHAKHLSFCLLQHPLQPIIHTPLGEYAVITLVKCGGFEDALEIFAMLPFRTVFAWTAVISGYAACGRGQDALNMYRCMRQEGVNPNGHTFVSLLIACGSLDLLREGMHLHIEALNGMFIADLFVSAALMGMYSKCGSITYVEKVLHDSPEYNIVLWTTMLCAYVENGQPKKALQLYKQMQERDIMTDDRTIVGALQACIMLAESDEFILVNGHQVKVSTLRTGRTIHVDAESKGLNSHLYVGNSLMIMYGKCGSIAEAESVFVGLSLRTEVSWTTMLTVYAEQKNGEKVLKSFRQMQLEGVSANAQTFAVVLQACGQLVEEERLVQGQSFLMIGMALHADARKIGYISNTFVGNTVISMYGRFGSLSHANSVFLQLPEHSCASWNSILSAFLDQGEVGKVLQLYVHMRKRFVIVDQRTFVIVLQACGILAELEEFSDEGGCLVKLRSLQIGCTLHGDVKKMGFDGNHFVSNSLISMYGKCGSLSKAREVFDGLPQPNTVSWNALLSAYVKSGRLAEAEHAFGSLPEQNVVSWNTMISAYLEEGKADSALEIYRKHCFKSFVPTYPSFMIALKACCIQAQEEEANLLQWNWRKESLLKAGQMIHFQAEIMGLSSDVMVGSNLVSMYSNCGRIKEAESVFFNLPRHEISSNALLSAYAELGKFERVIQLYIEMRQEGANFYDTTLVSVLHACIKAGVVELCRDIHFTIECSGYKLPVEILVHAYGSCAAIADAFAIFEMLPAPEAVSWSALVTMFSHHGDLLSCLKFYDEMRLTDVRPERASFLSILFACTHTGRINLGLQYFECMARDYGVIPDIQHYGLILDSLGRAGDFKRVEFVLTKMPVEPDSSMWTSLLASCHKHCQVELADMVFDCAVNLGFIEAAPCVLISNVYASAELLGCAIKGTCEEPGLLGG